MKIIVQFPAEIRELLSNDSAQAKQFRKYIRVYNNAFSFASLSENIRLPPGHGPPCFRICGQLFHRYGALLPAQNEIPNFSQLYIVEALNMRIENPTHTHCIRETMQIIQLTGILHMLQLTEIWLKWNVKKRLQEISSFIHVINLCGKSLIHHAILIL